MTEDFAQLEANIKYLSSGGGGGAGKKGGRGSHRWDAK